jgi:TRAP-type mannitol/chloroaromatic compound transport system permease small subunit
LSIQRILDTIDAISTWVGKAAAWLIIGLMTLVCVEVFKRYPLNAPTAWIFDASNMFYGTLFMLAGAYALAQNAHVRGDFLYSSMRPRTQAALDLVLYIVFFLPGIAALIYAGYDYAALSWRIGEHSNVTAEGPPIYHQVGDSGSRCARHAAGPGGDRALRRLPADRRMAGPTPRCQRDRRGGTAARRQRTCGRGGAPDRDRTRPEDR